MSTQKNTLQQLRKEYTRQALAKRDMLPDPFGQFEKWLQEALTAEVPEPNAMTLCTVGRLGQPSARIVLLKDFDDAGFLFYTNYHSQKGQQISENPQVSLSFFWHLLERQIRIEGIAKTLSSAQSDAYFNSRPRGSRLAAFVSPQSQVIESRDWLEKSWEEANATFGEQETIPRPENWGGYRVQPERVEFWQGRNNRLHDRILYERQHLHEGPENWRIRRLAP